MYRIENKESDVAYVETAEFLKLDKVELLAPEEGRKYQIEVGPGQTRDVIVRFGCNGFNIQKTYSYILVKTDEALYKQCLAEGQRQERGAGITLHVLQHQAGVLMVYKNGSDDKVLNETVTFTLEGLTIEGNKPDENVV